MGCGAGQGGAGAGWRAVGECVGQNVSHPYFRTEGTEFHTRKGPREVQGVRGTRVRLRSKVDLI